MAKQQNKSGYEQAAESAPLYDQLDTKTPPTEGVSQNDKPLPAKAAKPKRRMSTGLQTMARIERILDVLPAKIHNSVLRWLKTVDEKPEQENASPT